MHFFESVDTTFESSDVMTVDIAETSDDSFGIGWPSSSGRRNLIDSFPQSTSSHCCKFSRNGKDENWANSKYLGFYNFRVPQVGRINL